MSLLSVVSFVTGPVGRWVAIGLAFLVWTAYQREMAATDARNECQAEQLQKTLDEVQRQRDIAQEAVRDAERRANSTEQELAELEASRDQIIFDLKEHAESSCVVPSDVIERLRLIR